MGHSLRGRRVLITGASSGLGEALAHVLAREGAELALAARRVELLDQFAATPAVHGATIHTFYCDLGQPGAAATLVTQAEAAMGGLDLLILNAGAVREEHLLNSDEQASREMMEVNLWSGYAAMRAALPGMIERESGHIAVITSFCAYAHLPLSSVYAASKAAMASLSLVLANELPRNIGVTLVYPGIIRTPMFDQVQREVPVMRKLAFLGIDPEPAAHAVLHAVRRRKRRLYLTAAAKAMAFSMRLAPQWTDAAVAHIYRRLPSKWLGSL
jgi:3-oxoacyl-[acyl-carrier protein] reductase